MNDRKLISLRMMISFLLSLSLLLLLFKHPSQELDSNTAKLLLENQLKYSSSQLELSFVFAFIHLPTNGRKSNDVRLIGIVVREEANREPRYWSNDARSDLLCMFEKSRTWNENEEHICMYTQEICRSVVWSRNSYCQWIRYLSI